MKKIIVLVIAVASTSVAFSQSFSLGLKAGINTSSLTTNVSGLNPGKTQIGFVGGAFSRIGFLGFFVEPGLMYSQRKGSFENSGNTMDITLHYMDVPVMVGYSFLGMARIFVGPNFQFLLNASQSGNYNDPNFSTGNYNNATVGYQVGAGVDLMRFTVDLRYDGCINNLGKEIMTSSGNKVDYSTRASMWQITVGYKFIKL